MGVLSVVQARFQNQATFPWKVRKRLYDATAAILGPIESQRSVKIRLWRLLIPKMALPSPVHGAVKEIGEMMHDLVIDMEIAEIPDLFPD